MRNNKTVRQREPLRIPVRWTDQERAFVIQLERILDELYGILSKLDERIRTLEDEE